MHTLFTVYCTALYLSYTPGRRSDVSAQIVYTAT
jgi:hypothetical protein